jgi:hypothetical protein
MHKNSLLVIILSPPLLFAYTNLGGLDPLSELSGYYPDGKRRPIYIARLGYQPAVVASNRAIKNSPVLSKKLPGLVWADPHRPGYNETKLPTVKEHMKV